MGQLHRQGATEAKEKKKGGRKERERMKKGILESIFVPYRSFRERKKKESGKKKRWERKKGVGSEGRKRGEVKTKERKMREERTLWQ